MHNAFAMCMHLEIHGLEVNRAWSGCCPSPRPLPVIGNLLELRAQPQRSLTKLAKTYSLIICLKLGCITTVVVTSAPLTGEILQTFDTLFSNRLVPDTITALRRDEFGQSWMSISLLWKNLRQICNAHLFTHKILESNQHLRRHQVQDLLVAGTEATTSILEWAMSEMLHSPKMLVKAQAELEQVIGRGNPVNESDIAQLPY
ncbi:hypothetical protein CDL15_Pgr017796 [Punica granatum]|uniref:Geraniol 8-hydroxylase-like n=1 Tax=Punica granatum TaxID=22663 RepID=A0A218WH76_PUNGR|nr:hypothetical protein CDL15_Pgr017796 [Punica granatum]